MAKRIGPAKIHQYSLEFQSDNGHGLPLPNELMRFRTSHRGTSLPVAAIRLVRDREVPFIR
jgi:hypothetical protein